MVALHSGLKAPPQAIALPSTPEQDPENTR